MLNLKKSIVVVAMATLACASFAQRGGGFGRGGFGGGGLMPVSFLINNPGVQEELKLTDDEKTKLTAITQAARDQMTEKRQADGQDRAQMQKDMQAINEDTSKQVAAVLTADQNKRLQEIRIQQAGNSAITDKDVQAALGLSDDQKSKIADLVKTSQEANAAIFAKIQDGSLDRQEAFASMQKNGATLKEELGKILTDDQKTKLTALGGAPFKLEMPQGRGGGGR